MHTVGENLAIMDKHNFTAMLPELEKISLTQKELQEVLHISEAWLFTLLALHVCIIIIRVHW